MQLRRVHRTFNVEEDLWGYHQRDFNVDVADWRVQDAAAIEKLRDYRVFFSIDSYNHRSDIVNELTNLLAEWRAQPYFQKLKKRILNNQHGFVLNSELLYYVLVTDKPLTVSLAQLKFLRKKIKLNEFDLIKYTLDILIALRAYSEEEHWRNKGFILADLRCAFAKRSAAFYDRDRLFLNLENQNLQGVNLIGVEALCCVNLKGANLREIKLDYARQVNFTEANMQYAYLCIDRRFDSNYASFCWDSSNFTRTDLSHSRLVEMEVNACDFTEANFEEAEVELYHQRSHYACFARANFNRAVMRNFNRHHHAQLEDASFIDTTFTNSLEIFSRYELRGAVLTGAAFLGAAEMRGALNAFYQTRIAMVDDDEPDFMAHPHDLIHRIKLTAARYIIKYVMSDAVPENRRRDLLQAAVQHRIFQPESRLVQSANSVSKFASAALCGLFSRPPLAEDAPYKTAALIELEKALASLPGVNLLRTLRPPASE